MSERPYPFTEEQEAWLRDLETTDAPQTTEALHNERGFCCLGRACVTIGIKGKRDGLFRVYDGEAKVLPESATLRLLLRDNIGDLKEPVFLKYCSEDEAIFADALTELNDNGWSFKQIAAYIRANPWNVFRDPEESPDEQR